MFMFIINLNKLRNQIAFDQQQQQQAIIIQINTLSQCTEKGWRNIHIYTIYFGFVTQKIGVEHIIKIRKFIWQSITFLLL